MEDKKNRCLICGKEIPDFRNICDECHLIKLMEEAEEFEKRLEEEFEEMR